MYRAALLGLVVLLSLPAAATPLTSPALSPADAAAESDSRIGVLTLDEGAKSDFVEPSLDVAASVAIQREAAGARLDRYTLDERLRNASDDAKREFLFDAVVDAKIRHSELRDDERALRAAYVNGSIDAETFVRGLARIDAQAANLERALDRIGTHADRVPGFSLDRRRGAVQSGLIGYRGPVRDRALASIRGVASPIRLHLQASANGVVVSMLTESGYVREAYRDDKRTGETATITPDQVVTRMRVLYPLASNESVQSGIWGFNGGVYRITFQLDDGTLTAYLDGETEDVFYEIHDRDVDALAGEEAAEGSANGTRVVVNRSYPGGPLRIATYDNATGGPVAATVIVADTRVETGPDGVVWTLAPHLKQFAVTAVRSTGNVTIQVRPLRPPSVNDAER